MSELTLSFAKWFSERPRWLQYAAKQYFDKNAYTEQDIQELADKCCLEATGELTKFTYEFPANAFESNSSDTIRICSLSNVQGINALAPKNPLILDAENLTVVYGLNGSGKSGYVRLLKHICLARNAGALIGNVFINSKCEKKAKIDYVKNGIHKQIEWTQNNMFTDLYGVDIFDSSFGGVFVNKDDEVTYEPPILFFSSSIIDVCKSVASVIEKRIEQHSFIRTVFPSEFGNTQEFSWFNKLTHKTSMAEFDRIFTFSTQEEQSIKDIEQRLSETSPLEKAVLIRKKKEHIDWILSATQSCCIHFTCDGLSELNALKQDAVSKKKTAIDATAQIFCGSDVSGVGSETWKELWAAARKYSVETAYVNLPFPNVADESRCVLCHQLLLPETKRRFVSFEEFVKGELEESANFATEVFESALKEFDTIPNVDELDIRMSAAGLEPENSIACKIKELFLSIRKWRQQFLKQDATEALQEILDNLEWINEAKELSETYEKQVNGYMLAANEDNREELRITLLTLKARKWLFEHRKNVEQEIKQIQYIHFLDEAKKLTNTKALSQKKGDLAEVLITEAFIQRFRETLKYLGASHIKVELVKTKVDKGRVLHKIQLCGAQYNSVNDVLSEGESRIISIAAFLADSVGNESRTPLIFDDPISSLDQDYEESVVRKLIEQSSTRQVIVFTHRLSLLGTIRHYSEKKDIRINIICIRAAEWGKGEPSTIPISNKEIKAALNILITERIPEAKKANIEGNFELADVFIKSICSEFRTIIERSIENDLLCGIVQRFQRPVSTLKLKLLPKLNATDCALLDDLMTKYSGYEHSQADELPVQLPSTDELVEDLLKLKTWRDEYSKRIVNTL